MKAIGIHASCFRGLKIVLLFLILVCSSALVHAKNLHISIERGIDILADEWWREVDSHVSNSRELIGGNHKNEVQARASITLWRHSSIEKSHARVEREFRNAMEAKVFEVSGYPALRTALMIETEKRNADLPPTHMMVRQESNFVVIGSLVVEIVITTAAGASKQAEVNVALLIEGLQVSRPAQYDVGKYLKRLMSIERARSVNSSISLQNIEESLVLPISGRAKLAMQPVLASQQGESELAVSSDSQTIVIGTNGGTVSSNDGGRTWSTIQNMPDMSREGVEFVRRGDPSVGFAASGRFFFSYLGREKRGASKCDADDADCRDTVSLAISDIAQQGREFTFRSQVAVCDPESDPFGTDQPHIGIATGANITDREVVYVVWRKSIPIDATQSATCSNLGSAHFISVLSCSKDGGRTWHKTSKIDNLGRHPRLGVASDGKVYVVSVTSSIEGSINITRLTSCSDGLEIDEDFPVVVDDFVGVKCPVAGLDRCNNGNTLSSPTVSIDPANPNNVFVSFAANFGEGNENIVVKASVDGGKEFQFSTLANTSAMLARRFMPWSCAVAGGLYVGWYDREGATAEANDLTHYRASYIRFGQPAGLTLISSLSVDASGGVADPQCNLWPQAPRNLSDAESCSSQPQLAGFSPGADGTCEKPGPGRCDFSDNADATPSLKCCMGKGKPKYGDYTGIACVGQRAYIAWASGTAPPNSVSPPVNQIGVYFAIVEHSSVNLIKCSSVMPKCFDLHRGYVDIICPATECLVRISVSEICQKVMKCYECGFDINCLGRSGLILSGLSNDAFVGLVDSHGKSIMRGKRIALGYRIGKIDRTRNLHMKNLYLELRAPFRQGKRNRITFSSASNNKK